MNLSSYHFDLFCKCGNKTLVFDIFIPCLICLAQCYCQPRLMNLRRFMSSSNKFKLLSSLRDPSLDEIICDIFDKVILLQSWPTV